MDLQAILGTAIGLVALYWLLSTGCSFFLELLNSLTNVRGESLVRFVGEMLGGELKSRSNLRNAWTRLVGIIRYTFSLVWGRNQIANRTDDLHFLRGDQLHLTRALFAHDLVRNYAKPTGKVDGDRTVPSYLPSSVFSTGLFDLLTLHFRTTVMGQRRLWSISALPQKIRDVAIRTIDTPPADTTPIGTKVLGQALSKLQSNPLWRGASAAVEVQMRRSLGYGGRIWRFLEKCGRVVWDTGNPWPDPTPDQIIAALFEDAPTLANLTWGHLETGWRAVIGTSKRADGLHAYLKPLLQGVLTDLRVRADLRDRLEHENGHGDLRSLIGDELWASYAAGAVEPSEVDAPTGKTSVPESQLDDLVSEILRRRDESVGALSLSELGALLDSDLLPERLRNAMAPLVRDLSRSVAEARKAVESWYDGVMERATGWYKRRCMILLGVIAFVPVYTWDLDSIEIAQTLMKDGERRAAAEQIGVRITGNKDDSTRVVHDAVTNTLLSSRFGMITGTRRIETGIGPVAESDLLRVSAEARAMLAMQAVDPQVTPVVAAAAMQAEQLTEMGKIASAAPADSAKVTVARWAAMLDMLYEICKSARTPPPSACGPNEIVTRWTDKDGRLVSHRKVLDEFSTHFWDNGTIFRNLPLAKALRDVIGQPNNTTLDDLRKALKASKDALQTMLAPFMPLRSKSERRALLDEFKLLAPAREDGKSRFDHEWARAVFWLKALCGWLITCLLVSLGGPFWYETLGRLVNLRGTGEPPAPAPATTAAR